MVYKILYQLANHNQTCWSRCRYAFSWQKIFIFWFKFHRNLSQGPIDINNNFVRLSPIRRHVIINCEPIHSRIYSSTGLSEFGFNNKYVQIRCMYKFLSYEILQGDTQSFTLSQIKTTNLFNSFNLSQGYHAVPYDGD